MLPEQLCLRKEASDDLGFGSGRKSRVCRGQRWREDIPGRGHSMTKGPEMTSRSGKDTVSGEGDDRSPAGAREGCEYRPRGGLEEYRAVSRARQ